MKMYFFLFFFFVAASVVKSATNYSQSEIVAATLIMEAGGESNANAMVAVYEVIRNRAKLNNKTLAQICLARKQFSCWSGQDIEKAIAKAKKHKNWYNAMQIFSSDKNTNFVNGATHYHSNRISPPSWCKNMKVVAVIGNHIFYR